MKNLNKNFNFKNTQSCHKRKFYLIIIIANYAYNNGVPGICVNTHKIISGDMYLQNGFREIWY